jgi:hypothetical protein
MVGNDNVTFRFMIDDRQFIVKGKQMGAVLQDIQRKAVGASTGVKQFGGSVQTAGQQSAASAVNFQTGMQGMLNLSTAAVQTFTSISNLDRANNRAKQSIIAVARAEDLLNNKKERANEMLKAGITSGGKYANIQREIATAEADLTVKIEKKGIEQAAVNDIYMLFATNIANVTISSMQTISLLDKNQILLTKAKVVAQKISNASMFTSAKASYAAAIATAAQGKAAVVTTGATVGLTASVRALGAATKAFMASNPILLVAMAASTVAFALYESNIGGVKDEMNKLMGVEDSFEDQVNSSRDAIDEMTGSLSEQQNQLFKMPATYSGIMDSLSNLRAHYDGVSHSVQTTTQIMADFERLSERALASRPSAPTGVRPRFSEGGGTSQIGLPGNVPHLLRGLDANNAWLSSIFGTSASNMFSRFPEGGANEHPNRFGTGSSSLIEHDPNVIGGFQLKSPIVGFSKTDSGALIPGGIKGKQKALEIIGEMRAAAIDKLIKEGIGRLSAELEVDSNPDFLAIASTILSSAGTQKAFLEKDFLSTLKVMSPDLHRTTQIDKEFNDALKATKNQAKRDIELKAKGLRGGGTQAYLAKTVYSDGRDPTYDSSKILYRDKPGFLGRSITTKEFIRRTSGETGFSDDDLEKIEIAGRIKDTQLRGRGLPLDTQHDRLVAAAFGVVGKQNISGTIFKQKGLILSNDDPLLKDTSSWGASRKAAYEATGYDIGAVAGSVSPGDAVQMARNEKEVQSYANTDGGLANSAIGAAERARAYENGVNIKVPAWVKQQRNIYLENIRRARYGGTRQLDENGEYLSFSISGAVTGGFKSLRAFRADQRIQFQVQSTAARNFYGLFGLGNIGGGYTARQNQARAIQNQIAIGNSLAAAGLSGGISYPGTRKTLRGGRYADPSGLAYQARVRASQLANQELMARAGGINLLNGGFGLPQFIGSSLSSISLNEEIARQDALINSIGLNRTEAFRIIDAEGRGRNEIDDRVTWVQRNTSISTGVAVI